MDFSIMMFWQDITYLLQKLAAFIKKLLKLDQGSDEEGTTQA